MPSTFGIHSIGGELLEAVDCEVKADVKELLTSVGAHSAAQAVDVTFSFTVKGKGTTGVTVGSATGAPSGVDGAVFITNVTKTQTNEDWEGFSYTGVGYKYA